jgi:hypothetical protein
MKQIQELSGAHSLTTAETQTAPKSIPPETLKSISTPDKVDTHIGKLEFSDGVPTGNTVKALYDNLDRSRGFGVYLDNLAQWRFAPFSQALPRRVLTRPTRSLFSSSSWTPNPWC